MLYIPMPYLASKFEERVVLKLKNKNKIKWNAQTTSRYWI